jgi:RNA-binding protein Musashi
VQEYFTRFGYVMDVYMPRDKVNRAEHRGFGFVTFETEAAVARANAHGQHQIRCARAKCCGDPTRRCAPSAGCCV